MASLIQRAIIALAHQGSLLESALREMARAGQPLAEIAALLAEQAPLARSAEEVMAIDFHPINVHGIIGLWVAIEVAVEDTAVLILLHDHDAPKLVEAAGVSLPGTARTPLDRARRTYRRLERFARDGRRVADAYCFLLSVVGVSVTVDVEAANVLSELNYVRNCLLHRNGVTDATVAIEAPSLGLASGAQIKIASSRYLAYYDAAHSFARALLKGVVSSEYVRAGAP